MAQKAITEVDLSTTEIMVVACKQFNMSAEQNGNVMVAESKKMEAEESLKGGDGEVIREAFATVGKCCIDFKAVISAIAKQIDTNLAPMLAMNNGSTTASLEDVQRTSKKTSSIAPKE